ncbi:MAG TPA: sulfite exporter TauE/SafE family protein [Gemmatimonadaceae bacterium]|nr:sulfite exporter TauE/SafE family protein [Gemmatimonadaceae bacterium]
MLTITSSAAFAALVACASVAAGLIGALTGLGGGVILVPVLTLVFGVNLRYAVGASLISVIATSSGAASSYVKDGYANMRIGILMEVATTLGAISGATLASHLPTGTIATIFGIVLLYATVQSARPAAHLVASPTPDKLAERLRLSGVEPTPAGPVPYAARHVPGGLSLMAVAGAVSGLLGIGSGALKVLAMDRIMRLPFKVSTTTSNFMIGVTAAASAGIYLRHGYVDPVLACPVMLGVLFGALVGARVLINARVNLLRIIFAIVLGLTAVEMIVQGVRGTL